MINKIIELNNKSISLEKELLNRLLNNENLISQVLTQINEQDFYKFGKYFDALVISFKENKNIVNVLNDKQIQISDFLDIDSFRDIKSICRDLKEVSNSIKLLKILNSATEELPSEGLYSFIADIQRKITTEIKNNEGIKADINSVVNEFKEYQELYRNKKETGQELLGISTGYKKLDNIIDGLRPSHFWVIGGYTNMGKTSASLNIVANLIKQNKRVVYYSLEMNSVDIFSRLLGILTKDNGTSIIKGYAKDKDKVNYEIENIIKSKISIHTGKSELSEILFSMYEENLNEPVDLFVIDFIQILTIKNAKSEYETITSCSLELQQTAKRLGVPIIALSQISNDGAKAGDSVVMSFKGSGAIAAAADLAIEIGIGEESINDWKQKMNEGKPVKMKWSIRKNRHGKVGMIEMNFEGKTGIFEDYDEAITRELNKEF